MVPSTCTVAHSPSATPVQSIQCLFWPPRSPGRQAVHFCKCRENTHTHKIKTFFFFSEIKSHQWDRSLEKGKCRYLHVNKRLNCLRTKEKAANGRGATVSLKYTANFYTWRKAWGLTLGWLRQTYSFAV